MSEIVSNIKESAHKISEDYLLMGKDMNESLIDMVKEGSIGNTEILKRVCEHANQNVYLSLFNDPDVDNSNITFEVANFDKVSHILEENDKAMNDYNTPPEDFRKGIDISFSFDSDNKPSEGEKLANLNEAIQYKDAFNNFLNRIEIMKTAEEYNAEQCFNEMANDAKIMVANGTSLGDISKIATRFVKENMEGDFEKIAKCYDLISKELTKSNFNVDSSFTKISSQTINPKSKMLKPVEDFAASMAKIAGLTEMSANLKKITEIFDSKIKEGVS